MSDFGKTRPMSSVKEVARQQILDLKCSVCQDVPGKLKPVRSKWNFNRVTYMYFDFGRFFLARLVFCTGKSLSEAPFLQNMGSSFFCRTWVWTCCVQKLFWMSETISAHNMFSPGSSLEFSCIEFVIQWTIGRPIVG